MTGIRFIFAGGFAYFAGFKVDAREYGAATAAAIIAILWALWAIAQLIRETR